MNEIEVIYSGPDNIKCVLKDAKEKSSMTNDIKPKVNDNTANESTWETYTTYNLQKVGTQILIQEENNDPKEIDRINPINPKRRIVGKTCNVCYKTFKSPALKVGHIKMCHTMYNCLICNKLVKGHCNFETHVKLHATPRIYTCHICDKTYKSKSGFRSHMHIHMGLRFECYICQKSYPSHQTLQMHLKFHSSRQLYQCSICGKIFLRPVYLKMHKSSHTNTKKFPCDICGKKMSTPNLVKRHIVYNHT